MTSVSGTSSSSILAGMSSNRLSGLASGLDTDALIEAMTTTTRSRIAKVQQQKQLTSWKMDAFRSISSKLISFQNKYTSLSSSTALRTNAFFSKSVITPNGENSKYVKVSGNGSNIANVSLVGVKQLASNTSYVSDVGSATSGALSGALQTNGVSISKLAGESITFEYSGKDYKLTMGKQDYNSVQDVVDEMNKQLGSIAVGGGVKLSEILKVTGSDNGQLQIAFQNGVADSMKQDIKMKDVGTNIGNILGIGENNNTISGGGTWTGNTLTDTGIAGAVDTQAMDKVLAGKSLKFTYNGKTTTITLPEEAQLEDGTDPEKIDETKLVDVLQKELNKAFGSGRIDVAVNEVNKDGQMVKEISFQTKLLNGNDDETSTLSVSGDFNTLKALGMKSGDSNRVNLNAAIEESGMDLNGWKWGSEETSYITIVDKVSEQVHNIEIKKGATMKDIMNAINESSAGVKVSYLETSNQLSIASTQSGASGDFAIMGTITADGKPTEEYNAYFNADGTVKEKGTQNLGQAIFGEDLTGLPADKNTKKLGNYNVTHGQDAIVYVDYDGAGGADPVEIVRDSNTFDLNGMKVTVSGKFNETLSDDPEQAITFEAKPDTEKVTKAVKEMIEEYNEIIKLANDMVKEKKNRDYAPLTDEQKEEMKEEEIEKWEKKAKEGILFNNGELRSFTNEIRFLFSGSGMMTKLEEMGISTSDDYADAGKITFDEDMFRKALEEDPEKVSQAFAGYIDEDGNTVNGLMDNVKATFDKYAAVDRATKGIFVQMAGSPESALSMLTNTMQKQLDEYEDRIKTLQDKLADEAERYYQKFSSLEVYINNMNTQSSWLSQQFGGY